MQKTLTSIENLLAQWKALKVARPSEGDLAEQGHAGLTYEALDGVFGRWLSTIRELERKAQWLETGEAQVADYTLQNWVGDLTNLVTQAKDNGFHWLLQTEFFTRTTQISQLISILTDRRVAIARAIAKDFEKRGVEELSRILEATDVVNAILDQRPVLDSEVKKVKGFLDDSEITAQKLRESLGLLADMKSEIEGAHEVIKQRRADSETFHQEISAFRSQAESKSLELSNKLIELTSAVQRATEVADEGAATLSKTLESVRRQGLAGAFNDRSAKVLGERRVWSLVFVGAVACLGIMAVVFAIDLYKFSYEVLVVALLRRLALAAPLVWLGWYAAKQVGRLGRVQEDYEYKAATALAFQSYKRETEALGSTELSIELLRSAIQAFGDNPVRLYEHAATDYVTPSSELIGKALTDENVAILKKVAAILR